jgi:hypothetical protein
VLRTPNFQPPPAFGGVVTSRDSQDGLRYAALARILGLNTLNFEASLRKLLSDPHRQEAALSLNGEAARSFLDTLQDASRCHLMHGLGVRCAKCPYRS